MNKTATLIGFFLSAFIVAGCNPGSNGTGSVSGPLSSTQVTQPQLKVALLTSGPVNDGGWNQSAYDGVLQVQKSLKAKVDKQESLKADQFEGAMRDFASSGYRIIFCHGEEYNSPAKAICSEYPTTYFITTGGDQSAPNLIPIHIATEEGTYLQGIEAGYLTRTNKGGFVGGDESAPVKLAADAFEQGARSVNPAFTLKQTYINSWVDPVKAKTNTVALLNSGCDIITHNCDSAAKGVFDTAGTVAGVYTFGVNYNENNKAPNVVSSAYSDVPKMFVELATEIQSGKVITANPSLGVENGDVRLIDNPKFSSLFNSAQKAKIAAAKKGLADGTIKIKVE